jgi:hypothetical protein
MNQLEAKKFIEENSWRFAKTMSSIPHWYIVKQSCTSLERFYQLVTYIRENGYKQKFYSKEFIYCNIGEYKYWTMGNPLEVTKIINRAKI